MDAAIAAVPQAEFAAAFDQMQRRWRACVAAGGAYFE